MPAIVLKPGDAKLDWCLINESEAFRSKSKMCRNQSAAMGRPDDQGDAFVVIPGLFPGLQGQPAVVSPIKSGDTVPFVIVVLRPSGFEPSKIAVKQTTFAVHIINLAGGSGDPDFTILSSAALSSNAAATPAHQSKATNGGAETWRILTLPAGKYVATMTNHKTAKLQIEVAQ